MIVFMFTKKIIRPNIKASCQQLIFHKACKAQHITTVARDHFHAFEYLVSFCDCCGIDGFKKFFAITQKFAKKSKCGRGIASPFIWFVLLKISYQQQQLFFQTLLIVRQIRLSSSKRPERGSLFFMLDKRLKLNL